MSHLPVSNFDDSPMTVLPFGKTHRSRVGAWTVRPSLLARSWAKVPAGDPVEQLNNRTGPPS